VVMVALALARADSGLVGAVAPELRRALGLSDFRLGLLAASTSVAGAVCSLPAGWLVDNKSRRIVLGFGLIGWSVALGLAGLASGLVLFATCRIVSGCIASVARPGAVSLVSETCPSGRRARALAGLDAAQALGGALSFLVVALAVGVGDWRLAFLALGVAGLAAAGAALRLPRSRALDLPSASCPLTTLHALRVRTNVVVIGAESVSNFFFAGAATFTVLFVSERFGFSTGIVDLLAPLVVVAVIAGILFGGRLADRARRCEGGTGRLRLAAGCQLVAAVAFVPALLTHSVCMAAAFLAFGAGLLGASAPCLDAVRVDVIPVGLRGRAEAARGLMTLASTALGPVTFGFLADALGGRNGRGNGVDHAFLVMLVPLAASGFLLLAARRSYARDAAAAGAYTPEVVLPVA
jgi:MFS family permease